MDLDTWLARAEEILEAPTFNAVELISLLEMGMYLEATNIIQARRRLHIYLVIAADADPVDQREGYRIVDQTAWGELYKHVFYQISIVQNLRSYTWMRGELRHKENLIFRPLWDPTLVRSVMRMFDPAGKTHFRWWDEKKRGTDEEQYTAEFFRWLLDIIWRMPSKNMLARSLRQETFLWMKRYGYTRPFQHGMAEDIWFRSLLQREAWGAKLMERKMRRSHKKKIVLTKGRLVLKQPLRVLR